MFVLDEGTRFVIPRTEMTYPGHSMKLHRNAADPVKSPVDHVMMDFEDACPYEFKGAAKSAVRGRSAQYAGFRQESHYGASQ